MPIWLLQRQTWITIGMSVCLGLVLYLCYDYYQTKIAYTDLTGKYTSVVDKNQQLITANKSLVEDIAKKSKMLKQLEGDYKKSQKQAKDNVDTMDHILQTTTLATSSEAESKINQEFKRLQRGVECLTGKPGCLSRYAW